MANVLIINEKPSVSREFARALGVKQTEKHDGYIEGYSDFFGCTIWITWCIGHLVTLSFPEKYDEKYKNWNIDDLPFLPKEYLYEVIPNVKKQFNVVKRLLNTVGTSDKDKKELSTLSDVKKFLVPKTTIYNAGDSGREGEYIQRLVYTMAGHNKSAKMKRIWIDSQTDEEIKNGIRNAKDATEYDLLAESAYMRAIEDYSIGINFSRALSCQYGYQFNKSIASDKYKPISVGRVMTCVLGMIVNREIEIRNFKPTSFYGIEADCGFKSKWKAVEGSKFFENPILYNDTGFKERHHAEALLSMFEKAKKLAIQSVTKKDEKKSAPLLYNLAELQNECSQKFKISPDKTLEIAQKLYESKLTTYPRTDARVLSTPVAKEIDKNLKGLLGYSNKNECVKHVMDNSLYTGIEKTHYCDDSKVTDHYAIIPTGQTNTSSLDELELNVFHLIIERFVSIFYPPAVFRKIEITAIHPSKEKFFTSEKVLTSPGYLDVIGYKDELKNSTLSNVNEKDILSAEFSIKEGQTTAPKRYNSGSLILAMENAGNLIEDEELRAQIKGSGIGTSATRGEIVKKLVKIGYIVINNKTQIVSPHKDGEAVYEIVRKTIPSLLSPEMTASWEKGLEQIANGEISKEKYKQTLYAYIHKNIAIIKGEKCAHDEHKPDHEPIIYGVCPLCGGDIIETNFGCGCSNYTEKNCWFSIGESVLKHISAEQFNKLLSTGATDVINEFVSKKGNKFSASVFIDRAEKKVSLKFPETEEASSDYICPKCNNKLIRSGTLLKCSCGYKTYISVCKKDLSESEITQLLQGEKIEIKGLTSKAGKKFDAFYSLDKTGKGNFDFDNK